VFLHDVKYEIPFREMPYSGHKNWDENMFCFTPVEFDSAEDYCCPGYDNF
jgi:hypothetical protein